MSPLFQNGSVSIRPCRHGPMAYLKDDRYIGRSLEVYGEYSETEVDLYRQLLGSGGVVVEAGANIGAHTVPLARFVGSQGRVYAFEPVRTNFHLLCTNMVLGEIQNVATFQSALGDSPGRVRVPILEYGAKGNFGGISIGAGGDEVDMMTIDGLGLERCSLIKLDVEGHELAALNGAVETIRARRPFLHVELDRRDRQAGLVDFMSAMGYRMWWHMTPLFNPDNFNRIDENMFGSVVSLNLLCVPGEAALNIHGLEELDRTSPPHPLLV